MLKVDAARAPSTLRVLFFGPVRIQLGTDACDVPCDGELSGDELWKELTNRFPSLKAPGPAVRLACNGEFIEPSVRLRPGDEIALIPPVSGG